MNIGIIVYGYPPEKVGGAELQAKALAKKLSAKNNEVTVFAGSRSNEIIDGIPNLKIIKIKYINRKLLRVFLAQLIAFFPRIKEESPRLDVLLCYQVNPPGIIGLFSKFVFKIPLITSIRAETEYKSFIRKFVFTPLLLLFSNRIIVQTPKIKKELLNIYSNKFFIRNSRLENIKIISNGVQMRDVPVPSFGERDGILYVGRLHKDKGIKYLITAMQGIDETLSIIGDGPEKNVLMQIAKESDIKFLGELNHEEVLKHMQKSKLLVLPTLSDGLPNVILEAMSVGSPVISTEIGGIPDVLEHGRTGFLVEPKNDEELRKCINILLTNDNLWQEMHSNCLMEAKKYSWEKVEEEVEKIIKEVLYNTINEN